MTIQAGWCLAFIANIFLKYLPTLAITKVCPIVMAGVGHIISVLPMTRKAFGRHAYNHGAGRSDKKSSNLQWHAAK